MIATIDATQAGQAILGALIITGYVFNRFQAGNTKAKVEEIHVLVNSRMSSALRRISQLEKALGIKKGAPVPEPAEEKETD